MIKTYNDLTMEDIGNSNITRCPACGRLVNRYDCVNTYDCHGIYFRRICIECYEKLNIAEKGYDGEYYTELDECIDYDY